MRAILPALVLAAASVLAARSARATSPDAGSGEAEACIARVVSPADGTSNVRNDIELELSLTQPCSGTVPVPTLRDPNGALVTLQLSQEGSKLTARPLGYLIEGIFEIDPGSKTDECSASPARVTHFRVGPGPDVRAIVFTPHDKYTTGSQLDSVEIQLSEPLAQGAETDIPTYVSVSGLDPADIYYLPETASILWSWKGAATGIAPTTTEKVTIRVRRGLAWASSRAMAADFEISVRPQDFLVHGWWPDAKACPAPSDPAPPPPGGGSGLTCSAGSLGSPLLGLAAFLLAPLLVRLALRGRG